MAIYILNQSGESETALESDELLDRYLPKNPDSDQKPVAGFDMDGTMFQNDIGVLVFFQKLKTPTFWELDLETFSRLLLPKKYEQALREERVMVDGNPPRHKPLDRTHCQLALALHRDICKFYHLKKQLIHKGDPIDIHTPVVNEFARKMLEFDRVIMKLEPHWIEGFKTWLMRTRFFSEQEIRRIGELTRKALEIPSEKDRFIDLKIYDSFTQEGIEVTEDRIKADLKEESPVRRVDTLPQPVNDILKTTRGLVHRHVPIVVITTNLQGIATHTVRASDYRFISQQNHGGNYVRGSRLESEDGKLGTKLAHFVLGDQKTEEARAFAKSQKGVLWAFAGDSTGDVHAMLESLRGGGIAIAVGPTLEKVVKTFSTAFQHLDQQSKERIVYVTY